MIMRSAASVSQLFAVSFGPRGARITRLPVDAAERCCGSSRCMMPPEVFSVPAPAERRPGSQKVPRERGEIALLDQRLGAREIGREGAIAVPERRFAPHPRDGLPQR